MPLAPLAANRSARLCNTSNASIGKNQEQHASNGRRGCAGWPRCGCDGTAVDDGGLVNSSRQAGGWKQQHERVMVGRAWARSEQANDQSTRDGWIAQGLAMSFRIINQEWVGARRLLGPAGSLAAGAGSSASGGRSIGGGGDLSGHISGLGAAAVGSGAAVVAGGGGLGGAHAVEVLQVERRREQVVGKWVARGRAVGRMALPGRERGNHPHGTVTATAAGCFSPSEPARPPAANRHPAASPLRRSTRAAGRTPG